MNNLVCGIEIHVELSTKTKLFCGCSTSFGAPPNTRCCPVCTAQPGSLPVLNKAAVILAVRAGLATGCTVNNFSRFDRKHYFYPDLPKGYQITQYEYPVCSGGEVALEGGKHIRIRRIHLEEDAGKLIHEGENTLVDYNRAGVPLIEIVSEPDIASTQEAVEYVSKLLRILRAAGVSSCRMARGELRCDVNVSVGGGTRTEIKNLNSLALMSAAIASEYSRQTALIESGKGVEQATLRYDEPTSSIVVMRKKEGAEDYRYFPEPDLPALFISDEEISAVRKTLPELPEAALSRYVNDFGLPENTAKRLVKYGGARAFFDEAVSSGAPAATSANLIVGTIFSYLADEDKKQAFALAITPAMFAALLKENLNPTACTHILLQMLQSGMPHTRFLTPEPLHEELIGLCKEAIEANPAAAKDYKSGKLKAIGGFFGYIKKRSNGRANITLCTQILKDLLK